MELLEHLQILDFRDYVLVQVPDDKDELSNAKGMVEKLTVRGDSTYDPCLLFSRCRCFEATSI